MLKREIAGTNDLIQLAAKKSGASEAQVRSVYNFIASQMKAKAQEESCHAINFPKLGIFYIRRLAILHHLKRVTTFYNSDRRKALIEKLQTKLKYMTKLVDEGFEVYNKKKRISNLYLCDGKTRKEVQDFQNEKNE